jgi:hypothetical protein
LPWLPCGQGIILEITVAAGDLRRLVPYAVDFCSHCGHPFVDFLKAGHQASHDSSGDGLSPTAVAHQPGLAGAIV